VDVRIIATSNRSLEATGGKLMPRDLFYPSIQSLAV
jgi:hypothetical protein